MNDNDLQTQSLSLLDPLDILSAKVNGIGFQSMMVICPNRTMGVKYSLLYGDTYGGKRVAYTYRLDGVESLQAINDPEVRAVWRQKVLAQAHACITKHTRH